MIGHVIRHCAGILLAGLLVCSGAIAQRSGGSFGGSHGGGGGFHGGGSYGGSYGRHTSHERVDGRLAGRGVGGRGLVYGYGSETISDSSWTILVLFGFVFFAWGLLVVRSQRTCPRGRYAQTESFVLVLNSPAKTLRKRLRALSTSNARQSIRFTTTMNELLAHESLWYGVQYLVNPRRALRAHEDPHSAFQNDATEWFKKEVSKYQTWYQKSHSHTQTLATSKNEFFIVAVITRRAQSYTPILWSGVTTAAEVKHELRRRSKCLDIIESHVVWMPGAIDERMDENVVARRLSTLVKIR